MQREQRSNQLTNQQDGGEAILEAFRNLHVDYVISSPGSEWPPIWEALARQKIGGLKGPTYMDCGHETLAVGVAVGYTQVTGRMQAVLLHAGSGLLQGAMGLQGARAYEVPMLVMSGESLSYGELDRLRSRQPVVPQPRRGRRTAAADQLRRQMGQPGAEPGDALSERGPRRRNGEARAAGAGLSQRAGRNDDARLDAAEAAPRHAGAAEDASRCRRTSSASPR